MKVMIRIVLAPPMMFLRLLLACAAFVVSISSSLMGLMISVFAILAMGQFLIGWWWNGIAFLVLAVLVSPIGLPLFANLVLNIVNGCLGLAEKKIL